MYFIIFDAAILIENEKDKHFICSRIHLGMEVKEMEANDFVNLIANIGFPMAVTTYLLIRLEKQIMGLTSSINKLNTIISTKLGVVIDGNNDNKVA